MNHAPHPRRRRPRLVIAMAVTCMAPLGAHADEAGSDDESAAARPVAETDDFQMRDWLAAGSGCRARAREPGDVTIDLAPGSGPDRHRAVIRFSSYGLEGDEPVQPGLATFARECAVRLAIYPTDGRRITDVSSRHAFVVDKDEGARIRLRSQLLVGDAPIGSTQTWLEGDESLSRHEHSVRHRASGDEEREPFERVACGQPKLVGLDLSVATIREDRDPAVSVDLRDDAAIIEIELEDCASHPSTQKPQ